MNITRTGKIARLPHTLRHQLNLRLQNGDPGRTLAAWLNARPDVQAILKEHFTGQPIRQQNLSEWRQGGYQDWLQDQAPHDLSHCLTENATAFTAGHPPLTDALNHWIATRLALRTRRINALQEKDPEAADKLLTKMIRDLVALQQSQTRARREQRQRDHLTFRETQARQKAEQDREQTEADHEAWLLHPDNRSYINKLWKETYPNDFVSDDEEEDEDNESEENSAGDQSNADLANKSGDIHDDHSEEDFNDDSDDDDEDPHDEDSDQPSTINHQPSSIPPAIAARIAAMDADLRIIRARIIDPNYDPTPYIPPTPTEIRIQRIHSGQDPDTGEIPPGVRRPIPIPKHLPYPKTEKEAYFQRLRIDPDYPFPKC